MDLKLQVLNRSQGRAIPSSGKVEEGVRPAKGPLPSISPPTAPLPEEGIFNLRFKPIATTKPD
jgi:hypothetical protein